MMSTTEVRELIDDAFEELALAAGGLVATEPVPDEVIWKFIRNLEVVRGRTLRRIGEEGTRSLGPDREADTRPHPAIEQFLRRLREEPDHA